MTTTEKYNDRKLLSKIATLALASSHSLIANFLPNKMFKVNGYTTVKWQMELDKLNLDRYRGKVVAEEHHGTYKVTISHIYLKRGYNGLELDIKLWLHDLESNHNYSLDYNITLAGNEKYHDFNTLKLRDLTELEKQIKDITGSLELEEVLELVNKREELLEEVRQLEEKMPRYAY